MNTIEHDTMIQHIKQYFKELIVCFFKIIFEYLQQFRVFRNFVKVFWSFDVQSGEIIMGLILMTSIFGYDKVEPYAIGGNFWVFWLTFLGAYNIYAATNFESELYLWCRIKSQFLLFITSVVMLLIIHGLNLDSVNHGGEGATVFWYLPPITSLFFIIRNYHDLIVSKSKRKKDK